VAAAVEEEDGLLAAFEAGADAVISSRERMCWPLACRTSRRMSTMRKAGIGRSSTRLAITSRA